MSSFLADEKGRAVLHFTPNPLSLKPHQIPCFTFKTLIFLDKHGTLNQRVQGSNPCTPTNLFSDLTEMLVRPIRA
jgi:hypothetical protein